MKRFFAFFLTALLIPVLSFARVEVRGLELVVTAPVDAGLDTPDIRNPVDVWVEMIDGAKATIDLHHMYAVSEAKEPLEKVVQALERAGQRNVKIRMLLEKKMERASSKETIARLEKIPGAEIKMVSFSKLGTNGIIHLKAMTVDGREAFVGSQNFDWRSVKHIHEVGFRITRPALVKQVQATFTYDWNRLVLEKSDEVSAGQGDPDAYIVGSPPKLLPTGMKASEQELVALMNSAKQEIVIQVLEFSPTNFDGTSYPVIESAIKRALARRVKVKLLVSHWNTEEPGISFLKKLTFVNGIEVRIVTIPPTKEGFIPFARVAHSKYMVIDSATSWVGTSNWEGGYLDKSRNLEVVMKDRKMAERIRAMFEQVWTSPHTERVDPDKKYPKPKKG